MPRRLLPLLALLLMTVTTAKAATLDNVRQKGWLTCGVNVGLGGFSLPDSQGQWKGLDVDVCRAVAAAVFGDATKVRYQGLTSANRFTALQSGEVDILSRNTTFTFLRDVTVGLRMVAVNYYDGQGFLAKKSANIKTLKELAGATVCMLQGSTHEMNMVDWMKENNLQVQTVLLDSTDVLIKAFLAGRCDVASSDGSNLASIRATGVPNSDDYVILPELISKEPLGPMVRRADDQWLDIVRWSMMAMIEAEELGITAANADKMAVESRNPTVQRLLGKTADFGKLMGLDNAWALNIIRQVGNYGESFDRNVGKGSPLKLDRGMNALWSKGGLMYAIPFR